MIPDLHRQHRINMMMWTLAAILLFILAASLISKAEARPRHYQTYQQHGFDWGQQWQQPRQYQKPIKRKRIAKLHKRTIDANGNRGHRVPHWIDPTGKMVQVETVQGFKLTVHPAYASKFLKFFALLKEHGFNPPKGMVGCYSRAHKRGSNHAIGAACDIQTGWNRTVSFMYGAAEPLIRQAGLFSGCSFGDCGHIEAVRGLFNKAPNLYASLAKFKAEQEAAKDPDSFELATESINTQGQTVVIASARRKHVRHHHNYRIARR